MRVERFKRWLITHRGLLLVTLLALLVRVYWNVKVHPPLDYVYSDMGGYLGRASALYYGTWEPAAHMTLFPYGAHVFYYLIKLLFGHNHPVQATSLAALLRAQPVELFGRENGTALGVSLAVVGALAVAFTYATAERVSTRPWVHRLTGLLLIVYYPWISLGGYTLSETPFSLCVSASAFYGLRLADKGRPRDAWLAGLAYALGATIRPQILLSAALFFLVYLLRRRAFHNMTRGLWARFAAPLVLILAASSVRTYWHTSKDWHDGIVGLVSTNGPLNFTFGRCHSTVIESYAPDGRGYFSPPSLNALKAYVKDHPGSIIRLDPPLGDPVKYNGHMWEPGPTYETAWKCVKATGYLKQVRFALTHVVLLWGYNYIWPDQGQKAEWRVPMLLWCGAHAIFLLPPAAIGMLLAFQRRRARWMLVALHVWAVVLVAMIYFGDTRYRAPYDGLLVILAFEGYASLSRWVALRLGGVGKSPRPAAPT